MKRLLCACWFFAGLVLLRGEEPGISIQRLDALDQRGYFTPPFKQAVHNLIQAREAVAQARIDTRHANERLPGLQKQSDAETARVDELRKELAAYAHPEKADLETLRDAMKNPAVPLEEKLTLAQAFLWSYPTDPHQAEAMEDLQQIRQQIAGRRETAKQDAAARSAARLLLVQRAKAGDLSLTEWRDFLRDMSQQDLLGYLGPPRFAQPDYWIYTGPRTWVPATQKRAGLRINFNGTRVLSVVPVTP